MFDSHKFVLQWETHEQARTTTLETLWKNETFVDVTLVCDDGILSAHQVILSAASPFFHKLLQNNPQKHPYIYLRNTLAIDMEKMLEYVYSGKTEVAKEGLKEFFELANSFQVKGIGDSPLPKKEDIFTTEEVVVANSNRENAEEIKSQIPNGVFKKKLKIDETAPIVEQVSKSSFRQSDFEFSEPSEEKLKPVEYAEENSKVEKRRWKVTYLNKESSFEEHERMLAESIFKTKGGWQCSQCPYARYGRSHVIDHASIHFEGFLFTCSICDKKYKTKKALGRHFECDVRL